jgi:topoisomerase-4 subunit B
MSNDYDSSAILVLKGLDPVRRRPGMYTDTKSPNHIAQEIIDNSVDEAMAGHSKKIAVTLTKDGYIRVEDDGRGMPVDIHPTEGKSGVEVIMETLHGGGKFGDGNYDFSGGLHGVGASVTNALSEHLIVEVKRNGKRYKIEYKGGNRVGDALKEISGRVNKSDTGTIITFKPDPKYFDSPKINVSALVKLLRDKAILCAGLTINITNEITDEEFSFFYETGLTAFLQDQDDIDEAVGDILFANERNCSEKQMNVSWACYFSERPSHLQQAFVNFIPTIQGGTHVNALRQGLFEGVREYADIHNLLPRNLKLSPDDVWKNTNFVISLKMKEPNFAGQTKERLSSRECAPVINTAVKDAMSLYLSEHKDAAEMLLTLVLANANSRLKANKKIERKQLGKVIAMPGKLTDCETSNREEGELFVVEGDSAGGSAKQARNKQTQAIMPLRGKILNCWEKDESEIMRSEEIKNIATAIGVNPNSDDLSGLRYGKICILADADSDGLHIATLFAALFVRHFPSVVRNGSVYVAMPPLYRIDVGKKVFYALDDDEKEKALSKIRAEKLRGEINVQRFKGLGEMNPSQLKETTMDPMTRRLVKLTFNNEEQVMETFDMLLRKKRSKDRKSWLENDGDRLELEV